MKAVLRLTGLKADTLRAWERRYKAVSPRRSPQGRRAYSDPEVNRLRLLVGLVGEGFAISSIARLPDRELVAKLNACLAHRRGMTPLPSRGDDPVKRLLAAAHRLDFAKLRTELVRVRFAATPHDFIFYLIPQLMREVGTQVACNRLGVAEEHALSELIRQYLQQAYVELEALDGAPGLPLRGGAPPLLVFCTPENQFHDLGLLIAAISCRYAGVRARFLGANLPAKSLASAVRELRASAVVLSVSDLEGAISPSLPDYLTELDRALPAGVSIWIGGSGAHRASPRRLKRDLWIFESIEGFEEKLSALAPQRRA
jgi:DNA-binding transcriptional MerR regulator